MMKEEVLEEMLPYLTTNYGNPGSIHSMGVQAAKAVEQARKRVAEFFGASSPDQIIFTSGGTEGNNLVFAGVMEYLKTSGKTGVAISAIEHDSIRKAADTYRHGWIQTITPNKNGVVSVDEVKSQIDMSMVGLVSVMSANNELGTINPVQEICEYVHQSGALFHTDAVQAAGMYPLNVATNGYDFVTISSHKIHGPKGMGAVYAARPELLTPLIYGGAEQEFGLRGGTENVAGIVGFGKACELAGKDYTERGRKRIELCNTFMQVLEQCLGSDHWFAVNGDPPLDFKTVNLRFDGIDAESMVLALSAMGVCVSAGSACRAHESEPSRTLLAIGLTPEQARSSIRVSFSDLNTKTEAVSAAQSIASYVKLMHTGIHG